VPQKQKQEQEQEEKEFLCGVGHALRITSAHFDSAGPDRSSERILLLLNGFLETTTKKKTKQSDFEMILIW